MQKIVLIVCFLLSFHLNWGQTPKVVPIANVDFSQNESTVFELNGESQYKTIICQRKNQLTTTQLKSIIEAGLNKVQVSWLRINAIHDNGEIIFEVDPNTSTTTRECTFLSTFNRSRVQIVQAPRASIAEFNVTGGGSVTLNGRTTSITLSGSETGVIYSLYRNGTKTISKSGTGSPIIFTGVFYNGIYTIKGEKNGAERTMPGNASFTEYSVFYNVTFKSTIVYNSVNIDGGVYTINFALTGNGSLGDYRRELSEIIDLCNNGNIPTWNKEYRIFLLKSTMEECLLGIYISPNISTATRTSQLDFSLGRQIKLVQATGGNVVRFNVLGNGNILPGDKFYVELDGAQRMTYGLYLNGVKIKEQMGSMDRVKFNDLTQLGTYTIKAETEGQTIAMNGSVVARDMRQYPSHLIEESYTDINQKVEDITFYDGIGRTIQSSQRAASPSGKDLISFFVYNREGLVTREYLPYTVTGNGNFRANSILEQNSFYTSLYGQNPYAYSDFRYGSDNQISEKGAPGAAWQINANPNHTTRYYRGNETNGIKYFTLENNGLRLKLKKEYPSSALLWNESAIDQSLSQTEYIDFRGNVVCKKDGTNRTNYIYDDLGRLRYILSPMQDSLFSLGTQKNLEELQKYGYYMEYDKHGNIYKQFKPGAGYSIYLYDKRGRLVLSQDAEQRTSAKWTFIKYDYFNRPVITGICSGTEVAHKTALAAQAVFGERRGSVLHGYTNLTYPTSITEGDCLNITYYDDYSWNGHGNVTFSATDALGEIQNDAVVGQTTGIKTKVLGISANQWLISAIYYDKKYQTVQTVSQLYPSGSEIISNRYNFTGQVVRVKVKQTVNNIVTEYNKYYTYDQRGRQLKTEQQITGDNTNGKVTLEEYTYNEVGDISQKKLHNGKEIQNYQYHIGGFLTNVTSPSFSYQLDYDKVTVNGAAARYDGNINSMIWKNGSGTEKAYVYTYDNKGQITAASYREKSGTAWGNTNGRYNVDHIAYDRNGNIRYLDRNNATGGILHSLSYKYNTNTNGNAISQVTVNGTNSGIYTYNQNGNLLTDGYKGSTIRYNELDLISGINKGTEKISYIYKATGEKIAMKVGSSLTYYRGLMVYSGEVLSYIIHPAGMARKNNNGYIYNYFLKDQTGSTRVLLEATGNQLTTVQTTEYYPFGLAFSFNNLNRNKYLFNGKELQDGMLGNQMLGLYDYGSRFYDPVFGRWFSQDPSLQLVNPYLYCGNNPILYVDKDGELFWLIPALVGATLNIIENWNDISSSSGWKAVGKFIGYMGVGAASGYTSFFGGIGGAAIGEGFRGMANSLMAGNDWGTSLRTGGNSAVHGALGSIVGAGIGKFAQNNLQKLWGQRELLTNISTGVVENATSGYTTDVLNEVYVNKESWGKAAQLAAQPHKLIGNTLTGAAQGYYKTRVSQKHRQVVKAPEVSFLPPSQNLNSPLPAAGLRLPSTQASSLLPMPMLNFKLQVPPTKVLRFPPVRNPIIPHSIEGKSFKIINDKIIFD